MEYLLSEGEKQLRNELEQAVNTGFVLRGKALASIEKLKLYRDDYDNFKDYCTAVFGLTFDYIRRCIRAAQTYDSISGYLKNNNPDLSYPMKQRQLRPIFQADLSPIEAGEVWVMAVNLAGGVVPTSSIVKDAVKLYLQQKYPPTNPFRVGQICRIDRGVTGKKNCWCLVAEVKAGECVVDTWDGRYLVAVDDLSSMKLTKTESEQMFDLGERMTAIGEVGELDEAALWLLRGLERLKRSQLNSIEERLLQVLEDFYIFHNQT
ncbi:MAG: hypothetical protein AB4368_30220 [Xenococcaceae cyanobacterium]